MIYILAIEEQPKVNLGLCPEAADFLQAMDGWL
jgi:hypothetical protein